MGVLAFAEEHCTEVREAGGKGASLARLAAMGLPVPPGFVVCCDALEEALGDRAGALRAAIADAADEARLPACAAAAQELVAALEIPERMRLDVRARYAELGDDAPVAVRSSAASEDGDAASFAGQQETYLNVRGGDQVLERVRDCWASFFTERALFYRARKGSLEDLGMAVVVQALVSADVAGVMFTVDPVHARKDRILVEAVLGLGEAVVSGEVTPDHYLLKRDGRVARETIAVQPLMIRGLPGGGTEEHALTPAEGGRRKLDDATLAELARIGCALQDAFGAPQDVEWAVAGGRLFILQARPVTA
ncbi:MAG TPA: PEP/pyruvate-binding domain-containing protein [Baekduia sp.]